MKKYKLTQINEFTYSIKVLGSTRAPLYECMKKMIKGSFYDEEIDSLFFAAETVATFEDFISANHQNSQNSHHYNNIKMIDELTKQIIYLKKLNYGFYGFDIQDIIVINNDNYIFCSADYLVPLINEKIVFYSPINIPYFGSPEILLINVLPSQIDYRCAYYSLATLLVYYLTKEYLLVGNEVKSDTEIEKILTPLQNTKLYWFLKRCLYLESDKRRLLLI